MFPLSLPHSPPLPSLRSPNLGANAGQMVSQHWNVEKGINKGLGGEMKILQHPQTMEDGVRLTLGVSWRFLDLQPGACSPNQTTA